MEPIRFLRIQGTVREGNQYTPKPGFETNKIPACYDSTGHSSAPCGYTLAVFDHDGKQAWEGKPALRGGVCGQPGRWSLSGYIPLLYTPGFYEIRFYNRPVYRCAISTAPPVVTITEWKPGEKDGYIAWKSSHGQEQLFASVACIAGNRTYPLLHNSHEHSLKFDLSKIPGGTEARISIRVSDGCRSAVTVSEPFQVPQKLPQVVILQPAEKSCFDATQPIALTGIARDAAGTHLPAAGLQWLIDGQPIGSGAGSSQVVLAHLPAGAHRIQLVYRENNQAVETSIVITVNDLQEWEQEWKAMFDGELLQNDNNCMEPNAIPSLNSSPGLPTLL